jgi:hypothetical protein
VLLLGDAANPRSSAVGTSWRMNRAAAAEEGGSWLKRPS